MKNFTKEQFEESFNQIIDLKISDEKIKNFLIDLNQNNLPLNAFVGALSCLKKRMKKIAFQDGAIDVCGTGGDKLKTLNISTAVCFVVAAAKIPVAKHGNKAVSSSSGSADIFSELGIKFSSDEKEIKKKLQENKLCFLFAPFFHEALKNIAPIRKELAIPTIFNFLGPLLNPVNTSFQLIGVSKKDVMEKMMICATLDSEQKEIYVAHGFDGMDEISLCDNSYLLKFENGKILPQEIIDPEKYGFKKLPIEALIGGDSKHNAQKLIALLEGEKSAYRDIVILNSAFAFKLARKVTNIEDGIDLAKSIIDQGLAKKVLEKCKI